MKILVVGSGGREHALVWKISKSPKATKIFCAPGNAGIADLATCIPINAEDIHKLLEFAQKEEIDLTVVGPEAPLAKGIVDIFEKKGLKIFGVSKKAAELEASKSFAKKLMNKYNIPTAKGKTFTSLSKAKQYVDSVGTPIVIKADGLASGKGVFVCATEKYTKQALDEIFTKKAFGDAGKKVVIEKCLKGEEVSFLAFTDGKTVLALPSSQDHKAIFDDDKGPNTGGMGAYSPAPVVTEHLHQKIMNEVMIPTVRAMSAEGRKYKGVLYAGLMIDNDNIQVLEFNARFGDPEAQPLLMRLKSDIIPIMEAISEERLHECALEIDDRATVCVVMASGGYPGSYQKGMPISGLDKVKRMRDTFVFHAGTSKNKDMIVATGGRVLGVTSLGDTVEKAIQKSYAAVSNIDWKDVYFRKDIGQKAVKRIARKPLVGIVMGSDSDLKVMEETMAALRQFGVPFEITVASAHRSPDRAAKYATTARDRGLKVIIAAAGLAAHLAGSIAAHTTLPVIGVPINASSVQGLDSLLSTVQMPPGIPVATVAIDKPGARNAGILAVQILAVSDLELVKRLDAFKSEMAAAVEQKAKKFENIR
ncbi:MAG: phosphoribosylamine--glycine ligase [Desulfobacterium sp.]|nr:phosphoribosylamine--glycine ligase [Desulfobacterium sp.]